MRKIIGSNAPICFQGEEGTGKEALAKLIHGLRRNSPNGFCAIDGESTTENSLREALLTLNGKDHDRSTAAPQNGQRVSFYTTLFVRRVDALQDGLQEQLLELIQRKIRSIPGCGETLRSIRLITATGSDLATAVRRKKFRQDLYYRLTTYHFQLPPLRERNDDIPFYIAHFAQAWRDQHGSPEMDFSAEALAELKQHDWPGNLDELNCVVTQSLQQNGRKENRVTKLAWQSVPALFAKSTEVTPLNTASGSTEIPAML